MGFSSVRPIGSAESTGVDLSLDKVLLSARERAQEIEQLRRLPADLVDDLRSASMFRLFTPHVYGGQQLPLAEGLRVFADGGFHDGSTGWCLMIANTTALLAGSLPPVEAELIFGDPDAITGGFAAPVGRAVMTGDLGDAEAELEVSGRWSWGSGTDHCTWIGGGALLVDRNGDLVIANDRPQSRFVFMPADDIELLDTWHVAGLKGTASVDYRADGAVVPMDRAVALESRPVVVDDPLYRFSTFGALALGVSSVMLGLARRAIEELVDLGTKTAFGSATMLAERAVCQTDLARADITLRSLWALVDDVVGGCWERLDNGLETPTDEERRVLRQTASLCAEQAVEIVSMCYRHGGGAAVFDDHPLQRVFRDVHVAQQHAMIAQRVWEPLGRHRFGLPTDTRLL